MSDFKTRLAAEQEELQEKMEKLNGFIGTDAFKALPPMQRELLKVQAKSMDTYNQCLIGRLFWLNNEQDAG